MNIDFTLVNEGWYCDDCGYIDSYSLTVEFLGKQFSGDHDGHFGYGELYSELDSEQNLRTIFEFFSKEFESIGLTELKTIDYEDDGENYFYNITIIKNGVEETIKVSDHEMFKDFFSFLDIEYNLTVEDNSSERIDWDEYDDNEWDGVD